jgi:flagellar motor protein MotB
MKMPRPSPLLLGSLAVLFAAAGLLVSASGDAARRVQARARARHLVGEALAHADQPDADADLYQKARAADPTYDAAPCQQGAELERLGHWSEAVESYRACIALDPRQAWAQVRSAESRLRAALESDSYAAIRNDLQRFLNEPAETSSQDTAGSDAARKLLTDIEQLMMPASAQDFPERYSVDEMVTILLHSHARGQSRYEGPRVPLRLKFHQGDAGLSSAAEEQLRDVARALLDSAVADAPILIEGYTDSVEGKTTSGRTVIARRRAEAVRDFLIHRCGIRAERLSIKALADEEFLDTNETPEGREANRRVELFNLHDRETVRGDARDVR